MPQDNKWLQFFKFLFFSLGAGVIEFGTFELLTLLLPGNYTWIKVAEVLSVVLSCLFNFTVNRKYTFKSCNNMALGMLLYGLFYLVMAPIGAYFIVFEMKTFGMEKELAKAIKMVINFAFDYLYCRFVLFRPWGAARQHDDQSQKSGEI